MAKDKPFVDPLEDIDPIMEKAFSIHDEDPMPEDDPVPQKQKREKKSQDDPLKKDPEPISVSKVQFPTLNPVESGKPLPNDVFSAIPISLSVELGRSQVSLKEVYELTEGSIIELERLVGEPLDLVVNGQVIAQGEVVAIDNNYGLRVTHIIPPKS